MSVPPKICSPRTNKSPKPGSTPRTLPRENWKISIGHAHDDQRHGGGIVFVDVAFPMVLVGRLFLPLEQLIADRGKETGPVIAAGQEHDLRGVIVAVVIM